MSVFCGRWALALLMGVTCSNAADPSPFPDVGGVVPPELPSDPRCTLSVSNPVVDYGLMSRWQLQNIPGGSVTPGTRSLTLSVVCPSARAMKLLVQGDAGEQGELRYGKRGFTQFRLLDAQLDGNALELRTLTPEGVLTGTGREVLLSVGQQIVPVLQDKHAKGKTLTARLEIQPVLSETEARVSNRQRSESMLTLTLVN